MYDKVVNTSSKVGDKIFTKQFKDTLDYHRRLPKFSWFGGRCRMDIILLLNAQLRGMIKISKRRYGVYNKAVDNEKCKMFRKCFPWW